MNAQEIVAHLKAGETVVIPTSYAFVFMRECEHHGIASAAISMIVEGGSCTMKIRLPEEVIGERV